MSNLPDVVSRLVAQVEDFVRDWDRAAGTAERAAARIRAATLAAGDGPSGIGGGGTDGIDEQSSAVATLSTELERLAGNAVTAADGQGELDDGVRRATGSVDGQSGAVRTTASEVARLGSVSRSTSSDQRDLDGAARRAADALGDLGSGARRAADGLDDADGSSRRLRDSVDGIGSAGRTGGDGLNSLSAGAGMFSRLGPGTILAAGAIVAIMPGLAAGALAAGAGLMGLGVAAGVAAMGSKGLETAFTTLSNRTAGLRAQIDSVFRSQLNREFAQLGTALSRLAPEFTGIARAIAEVIGGMSQWLRSTQGMQEMRTALGGVREFIEALRPGAQAAVQAFVGLGAGAAPAMREIGDAVSSVFVGLRDVIDEARKSGQLEAAFRGGAAVIRGFGEILKGVLAILIEMGASGGQQAGDSLARLGRAMQDSAPAIGRMATELTKLLDFLARLIEVAGMAAKAIAPFADAISGVVGKLIPGFGQLQQGAQVFGQVGQAAQQSSGAVAGAADQFEAGTSRMSGAAQRSAQEVSAAYAGLAADTPAAGQAAVDGMGSGMEQAVVNLIATATGIALRAMQAIKSTLGISSPSKLFADEVGRWIPAGIGEGIIGNASAVTDAMGRLPLSVPLPGLAGRGAIPRAGVGAGAYAAAAAGRGAGPMVVTLQLGSGADSAMGTAIAKLARTGQLKISANAVTGR